MALVLMSTEACHLCEQAQALLLPLQGALNEDLYLDDIAYSDDLLNRYGVRIPVLLHETSGAELDWPFDAATLRHWLQQRGCLAHSLPSEFL